MCLVSDFRYLKNLSSNTSERYFQFSSRERIFGPLTFSYWADNKAIQSYTFQFFLFGIEHDGAGIFLIYVLSKQKKLIILELYLSK